MNPTFAAMFGYSSPDEMIAESGGLTIKQYFDSGDRERLKEILASKKAVRDYRIPMVRRDGRPIWISMYAAQIINNVGETLYDGFAIDITERVLAESALRESEEQFRSIFENIRDAVGVGRGQSLLMGNRALREMFGYSAEEIAGMPVKNFLAPSVRARALSEWDIADARDGAFPRKITRGLRRDGGEFDMEASVATYRYYGNTYFMVVLRDITARLRAEEEIRRLNRHILTVQEEERQKVSRDLHDSVGQTILAAKLNVEMFQSDPSRYGDRLSMGVQFIDKASQELREIYMNLYPSILSDLGLSATIKWYANHMLEANGIRAHLRIGIRKAIAHEIEVGLYRIVQEIFSNILRHSGATEVRIELVRRKGSLALGVEDNGLGLNAGSGAPGTGHGIANMRHRAQAMGGAFSIATIPRGGTRITVTIREDGNGSH
ncbi:MAG TPA: PAS domain S-box protein [Spirochaetota bacterium]|nr:PAS domain S-box protein [Spirochaetota bacterium]